MVGFNWHKNLKIYVVTLIRKKNNTVGNYPAVLRHLITRDIALKI